MTESTDSYFNELMNTITERYPHERQFQQAVAEVIQSILPYASQNADYRTHKILERMIEPDRVIAFRVAWEDDAGEIHVNRGWRVQFNRAIGPYKGGLRFHPSVDQDTLKFLGFEQTFKNSLTGLPMGGGKGGADFDPKGRSDREIMRFCQEFMTNLYRYIGPQIDVPAGDIGVGSREIGYLFGQYMRLSNEFEGAITGKGLAYGGSVVRTEATGYGCVYFCRNVLNQHDDTLEGKSVIISGAGNVAIHAAEKAMQLGATVLTLSDSNGTIHDPDGINEEKLAFVKDLKLARRGRISEYADQFKAANYRADSTPWGIPCDIAMPCATQNELDRAAAETLAQNGVRVVCCGANMPCTNDAIEYFLQHDVLYAPGKAANAGGVAVSGLEITQNALRTSWDREEVDSRLRTIMADIHAKYVEFGKNGTQIDYVKGANVAGFRKVAEAMLAYGIS